MKKLYEKNEMNFALLWIGIYIVSMMIGDKVSRAVGIEKVLTAPICVLLTVVMYLWIRKNGLCEKYGLCRFEGSAKKYLYFIPLGLLCIPNVWLGVRLNVSPIESILYVISMLCVGFLEEVIFRGFLFKAMCRSNRIKTAIAISAVTFGFGHILNLFSGADTLGTILQICYACAIGFVFVIVFYKGKSLWPCMITHGVLNSLSIFANTAADTVYTSLAGGIFLCVVSVLYALFLLRKPEKKAA